MKSKYWFYFGQVFLWMPVLASLGLFLGTADQGLQMTDESSYLLIASDPWRMGGHGTFYGFVLHPLWVLGGSHVAGFRIVGFALLVLVALGLSLVIVRRGIHANFSPVLRWGAYPLLSAGALAFFSDGIRTPHYNWVVLVGAMIWCGGLLGVGVSMSGVQFWGGILAGGAGCALMILGKWPGALALMAISLLVVSRLGKMDRPSGFLRYWLLSFLIGVTVAGFVLVLYAGPQGVQNSLGRGWLIAQELGSHHVSLLAKYLLDLLNFIYRILRAYAWLVGPMLVLGWALAKSGIQAEQRFRILVSFGFLFGIALAFSRGHGLGGALNWNKESLMAGIWLTGIFVVAWPELRRNFRSLAVLGGTLLALPFALAFGTNTSMADYAGHAVVFWSMLGWLCLAETGVSARIGPFGLWATLACLIYLQGVRQITSLDSLWKIGSVWKETQTVSFGPEHNRLKINGRFHADLASARNLLEQAGFREGDYLIVISDMPGLVYLLGAKSVGVPWYESWEWEARIRFARAVLDLQAPKELEKAWVILAQPLDEPVFEMRQVWPTLARAPLPFGSPNEVLWAREFTDVGKAPVRMRFFRPAAGRS